MRAAPVVSVVVTAYNLARFLPTALDSALGQDWPRDAVQVIVVDDGSTDETPAVLERYRDRVTVIRQDNAGLPAAAARGLGEARGDYVALLDADDEWPADRVHRHVTMLEERPELGLVHGDMEIIDDRGATVHPSFFAAWDVDATDGWVLGRLMARNFVSGGAATFRASLLPMLLPLAPQAPYPDWWIAANVAAVAPIALVPGCANRYRRHEANMGLDTGDEGVLRAHEREVPWRQWMLANLAGAPWLGIGELRAALYNTRGLMTSVAAARGRTPRELYTPTAEAEERAEWHYARAVARAGSRPDLATRDLVMAYGHNPWHDRALADLEGGLPSARPGMAAPAPDNLLQEPAVREHAYIVLAGRLTSPGAPVAQYLATARGDTTSLIVAMEPDDDIDDLARALEGNGIEDVDVVAITDPGTTPGRILLRSRADGGWLGEPPASW